MSFAARRSRQVVLALLVALLAAVTLTFSAPPAVAAESLEQELSQRINAARHADGAPGLQVAGDLGQIAVAHAHAMAARGQLAHNPDLRRQMQNWHNLGENVGYGRSVERVDAALMASAPHRANRLSRTFTQVGVGVARDSAGRVWVTEVFRRPAGDFSMGGDIGALHPFVRGVVGSAISAEYPVRGGRAQDFTAGLVVWAPGIGAHEVHGAIRARYADFGGPESFFGVPVASESGVPGGRVSRFQGGRLFWSPEFGTREVHGEIERRYEAFGGSGGFLGLPVTDEFGVRGGRASRFTGGQLLWSPEHGAREIHGAIGIRYDELGGPGSELGLPTSDEYAVPGGRRSDLQHGSLVWDAGTNQVTVRR